MPQRNKNCIAVTGDNKDILVVFNRKSAYVHDLNKQGQLIEKITIPDMNFGGTSIASCNTYFFFWFNHLTNTGVKKGYPYNRYVVHMHFHTWS